MASAKAKSPQTRKDPSPRHLGGLPFYQLQDADPTRKYVWVSKTTPENLPGSLGWYELYGWEVVNLESGGVRPYGMRKSLKEGDAIEVGGMLLMSKDLEEWQADVIEGQKAADARERQMIKKRGQYDPMRGIGNLNNRYGDPYVIPSVEISPLRNEIGGAADG